MFTLIYYIISYTRERSPNHKGENAIFIYPSFRHHMKKTRGTVRKE